jgi:uncharacterized protein (TIRG00374 family)
MRRGLHLLRNQWRIITSVAISVAILLVALFNRERLLDAFAVVERASPFWIAAACGTILLSYFMTSQVLVIGLRSMGYRLGLLRLWASALVAVIISQSVPAGGVGSYAFLVSTFNRRGVPSGKATLAASLETLSYVSAMLLVFLFSLFYLLLRGRVIGEASYVAAGVALLLVSSAGFLLTRNERQLKAWALGAKNWLARLLRRSWGDRRVLRPVNELLRGRELLAENPRSMALLVVVQLVGLLGHSLAMLMIFRSLDIAIGFPIVVAAFGIALITSTFNVLPGGGGTVEFALVAILRMSVGVAAAPAAIIFRLLNFWLLLPVAALCYYWLMHEPTPRTPARPRGRKPRERSFSHSD